MNLPENVHLSFTLDPRLSDQVDEFLKIQKDERELTALAHRMEQANARKQAVIDSFKST